MSKNTPLSAEVAEVRKEPDVEVPVEVPGKQLKTIGRLAAPYAPRCNTLPCVWVHRGEKGRDFHGSFHGVEGCGGDGAPLFLYWWLIVRHENAGMDILILDGTCRSSGVEVLPVFGFKEEAQMFLRYGVSGALAAEGWRVRRSSGGELISALCGPCKYVGRVALDPLPHRVFGTGSGCACPSRNQFVERLQDRHPGKVGASALA